MPMWRGWKDLVTEIKSFFFGGDLITMCQQARRSARHDLVLVGGYNPIRQVEVG